MTFSKETSENLPLPNGEPMVLDEMGIDHELLSTAMEVAKVGFYDWDIVNDKAVLSKQMRKDWGIKSGMSLEEALQFIDPRDRENVLRLVKKSMDSRIPYYAEYRVNRPDGSMVWIEAHGKVKYDDNGQPVRFFGTSINITDRKNTEAELVIKRQKVETMLDISALGIGLMRGRDLVFERVNDRLKELVGPREYIGKKWSEVYTELPDSPLIGIMQNVFDTGEPYFAHEMPLRVQVGDNLFEDRFYDFSYVRFTDANGDPYGVFLQCQNVSERVATYKKLADSSSKLRVAKEEAEKANATKSAFLANMSHEIRTPLGAILGFSDLARDPEATAEEVSTYLSIVQRNSDQVIRIIDDILDLAKVEAGRVELEMIEFCLVSFIADFASLLGFRAREKGISLILNADSDLPERIVSDPTRLRQILTNSVGNAIKFTQKGSVTIHVCFKDGVLYFSVEDTGRGISDDQAQNLFSAFTQADVSTTRTFGGTGLGLVLTKHLCQLMGGDYILESSQLGKGSKFEATVKIERPSSAQMLKKGEISFDKKPEKEVASPRGGRLTGHSLLLVEDSPDNQVLVRLLLEREGVHLEIAENGRVGVEKALANQYDLVLMDIQMPIMDGHEAVQLLRSRGFTKPIVALTAHAMKQEADRVFQSGFTSFLSKPIDREQMVSLVGNLIKSSKNPHSTDF